MTDHRKPPKLDNWKELFKAFGVLKSSKEQRAALWLRDKRQSAVFKYLEEIPCASCGMLLNPSQYEADHTVELWQIDRTDPRSLRFWSLDYLQALGAPCGCHKRKSAENAAKRAKNNRIIRKLSGTAKPKKKLQSRPFPKLSPAMKAVKAKIDSDRRDDWKNRVNVKNSAAA